MSKVATFQRNQSKIKKMFARRSSLPRGKHIAPLTSPLPPPPLPPLKGLRRHPTKQASQFLAPELLHATTPLLPTSPPLQHVSAVRVHTPSRKRRHRSHPQAVHRGLRFAMSMTAPTRQKQASNLARDARMRR
eukprot:Rmarinus@m.7773